MEKDKKIKGVTYFSHYFANKVITKQFKVDSQLPSDEFLSEDSGLSIDEVKRGRRSLEAMGIIERTNDGFFIRNYFDESFSTIFSIALSFQDLYYSEVLEMRMIYEEAAFRLAFKNITESQLEVLYQILIQLDQEHEAEVYSKFDHLLHETIVKAADNRFLYVSYKIVSNYLDSVINDIRGIILSSTKHNSKINKDHWDFYYALKEKDMDLGLKAVKNHFAEIKEYVAALDFDYDGVRQLSAINNGGFVKLLVEENPSIVRLSSHVIELLGYKNVEEFNELTENKCKNLYSDEDYSELEYLVKSIANNNDEPPTYRKRQHLKRKDGSLLPVETYGHMKKEDGKTYFFSYYLLFSEKKNENGNYEVLMETLKEIYFEIKLREKKFTIINKMENLFDWGNLDYIISKGLDEEAINKLSNIWQVHQFDLTTFMKSFKKIINGRDKESLIIRLKTESGTFCWCKIYLIAMRDEHNNLTSIIGKIVDVDKETTKENKLIQKTKVDSFTNLLNKSTFNDVVAARLKAISACKSAIIFIDLDSFKQINDTLGHIAGDEAISNTVKIIKKCFRTSDLIARFGGDEFYIFLQEIEMDNLKNKIESVRNALQNEYGNDDVTIKSTASIGVSYSLESKVNYMSFLNLADEALYEAKANGKNQYIIKEYQK